MTVEVPDPQLLSKLQQTSGKWHLDAIQDMSMQDIENIRVCSDRDGQRKYLSLEISPRPSLKQEKIWVLVDTGASVDSVQHSLVPPSLRKPARQLKRFEGANGSPMHGGHEGLHLTFDLPTVGPDLRTTSVKITEWFYTADIACHAILSYGLLKRHRLAVLPFVDALFKWPTASTTARRGRIRDLPPLVAHVATVREQQVDPRISNGDVSHTTTVCPEADGTSARDSAPVAQPMAEQEPIHTDGEISCHKGRSLPIA